MSKLCCGQSSCDRCGACCACEGGVVTELSNGEFLYICERCDRGEESK